MDPDDPFAGKDDDRTIIIPRPGGMGPQREVASPSTPAPPPEPTEGDREIAVRAGPNPLVMAAAPLLAILGRLRNTLTQPDAAGLRAQLTQEIRDFERRARDSGISREAGFQARYLLCTTLDEMVMKTPWGHESAWGEQSLLLSFHQERGGGEKFFMLLDRLKQEPANNIDLLELVYICLALGFEGRFALLPDGQRTLDTLREDLYRIIRTQRGEIERDLSPSWQGVSRSRSALIEYVPLWVFGAGAVLVGFVVFISLSYAINRVSDPVFAELGTIARNAEIGVVVEREPPPPAPVIESAPPPAPKLRQLLAKQIEAARLEVRDDRHGETILVRGDGLFASGRAAVNADHLDLFEEIGRTLGQLPGRVLITGHTDSVPIRTPRFPSNWHLSEARAQSVLKLLQVASEQPERFQAEGRADTELVDRDNPRAAANRRVEITLLAAVPPSGATTSESE